VRDRFTALNDARKKAEAGEPKTLPVREFIKLWGVDDRDRAASMQIEADLANHGLTTVPDFRAVSLDRTIKLMTLPEPEAEEATNEPLDDETEAVPSETDDESSIDIGLTLGNLLSNEAKLVFVSPSASFEEAITAMQLNDFSQVAVLANTYTLHGAVSWRSIAQAKNANTDATFSDAIDRKAKVFDYDTRLLDVLATLQAEDFIFVRDYDRTITGIITTADVVNKYDETATPFFLIGEVDQELRQLIQNTFDEETARRACADAGLPFRSFDSMSIGQYQAVLGDPACWDQLGWKLHRKLFIGRLDEIRKVRNKVMHFNPDPIKPTEVNKLRYFLRLIRSYNK
jgi:CBS domain-containing protein